ncbi:5'/3'-nucleotidase SurE [Piscinibacterium candidicorallinum]|jgi:5'-nucleotidase|uniref:5'-nucleotidase SurE n=1 Tax=Piscinibacterium candidicorallinum TaxID=1793872 RepID=A0ABV7H765_9BURK
MRILLANDDGFSAPGIVRLGEALSRQHEVWIAAPDSNRSGVSNALTLDRPLYATEVAPKRWQLNGTPADCVHIALNCLVPMQPDLVVSGINNGENMGDDTLYSGTVAAAMEAYLMGLPAIAFSLAARGWPHLDAAADSAAAFVDSWFTGERRHELLNVNFPALPASQHRGLKVVRLGRRHAAEPVLPVQDPQGRPMYWIGPPGKVREADEGTDFAAVAAGYTSVTPLHVDLTRTDALDELRSRLTTRSGRE